MKREIKVKGRPIGKMGLWVYGIGAYKTNTAEHLIINAKGESIEVVNLCLWTGLKDKNGKEIYEGDMFMFENFTAVVRWNEELATFALQFSFEGKIGSRPLGEWENIEVIGNIYDNKLEDFYGC